MACDVSADRRSEVTARFGVGTSEDNAEVAAFADVLVLAVKPVSVTPALAACQGKFKKNALLVSLVAGTSTDTLAVRLPETVRIVRTMPNTPSLVLAGATAIAKGARATDDDVALVVRLFDAVGRTVVLPETQMNAVTGLSGSGPAYVMLVIEALADGGVNAGLSRETAQLLATQTVLGAAQLLIETGEHPARLKDQVASPAGTTIAGLIALESAGLRSALLEAVRAATARADELSKKA